MFSRNLLRNRWIVPGVLLILGIPMMAAALAMAMRNGEEPQLEEFRIETAIFQGRESSPFARNLTLFSGGIVYDYPLGGEDLATVFDPRRERFVLIDAKRRLKTTIATTELMQITSALKARADESQQPWIDPQFEVQTGDDGWIILASTRLVYRVRGAAPENAASVASYRQFADWYARLNATTPGNPPPFARLRLNETISEKGIIPSEVELTILPKVRLPGKKVEIRSRHDVLWTLSGSDRQKIETTGSQMASFQEVSFQEFRGAKQ